MPDSGLGALLAAMLGPTDTPGVATHTVAQPEPVIYPTCEGDDGYYDPKTSDWVDCLRCGGDGLVWPPQPPSYTISEVRAGS